VSEGKVNKDPNNPGLLFVEKEAATKRQFD